MKRFLMLAFTLFVVEAFSSDTLTTQTRVRYSFSLQVGSLVGKQQATAALGVTNWFTWQRVTRARAGVGLGWENYEGWQTVPLSLQMRFDLSKKKKNPWFVYGGFGRSWARLVPDYRPFNFERDDGGLVYAFGIGKSVRYEKMELSFQIGQNVQRVSWEQTDWFRPWFSTLLRDSYANRTNIEMTLRRVAFTISVRWN